MMAVLSEGQVRRKPLVVILGPTAVGKSRVAIEIAKRLGSDILTADSRQVYRGMDVGTDKPPLVAREGVAHHLTSACFTWGTWTGNFGHVELAGS